MSRSSVRPIHLLSAILLGVSPALASEGRIPIPFTSPVATPITITASGRYVLTGNISAAPAGPVIAVVPPPGGSVAVDIDLNGFVLSGVAGTPVVAVLAGSMNKIRVSGGTLTEGSTGISVAAGTSSELIVEDVTVAGADGIGIHLTDVPSFAIRRSGVFGAGSSAIVADSASSPAPFFKQGTIENNRIKGCGGGILVVDGSSVAILNNRIDSIGPPPEGTEPGGIHLHTVDSCLVSVNTIEHVFGPGNNGMTVHDTHGCKFYNNTIREVGERLTKSGDGILIEGLSVPLGSFDNLLLDNVIIEAGRDGIHIGEGVHGNHVDRNVLNFNGRHGLHIDVGADENHYGRNTAEENEGSSVGCFTYPLLYTKAPAAPLASSDFCDENGSPYTTPPPNNYSFGDNLMPGANGLF